MYKFRDSQDTLSCLICFEPTNQHFYCQKCSYLICKDCFKKYQNYKYNKCPQCRHYINRKIFFDNNFFSSNFVHLYLPIMIGSFGFYLLGYKITLRSSPFFIFINIILGSQIFLGGFIILNLAYNPFLLSQFLFCIYYFFFSNT